MKKSLTNIVKAKKLREVQKDTLETIADAVMKTAGPYGTNTILLHDKVNNEYSKDGHKVLRNIRFYEPLEHSIQEELVELTAHIVKTIGDGTTSAIKMSSLIFNELCKYEYENPGLAPASIVEAFKEAVKIITKTIYKYGNRELTPEYVYNIALTSTNGNKEIAGNIKTIYEQFGMNVFIEVGISNTTDNVVKSYDGLTFDRGYTSPAFINTKDGFVELRNPRIYCFRDPIDTPEMLAMLEKLIYDNIYSKQQTMNYIPTLIMAPSISRDAGSTLEDIETLMYRYNDNLSYKPPLLIITGLNLSYDSYEDIIRLCGCKTINKYINPDVQKKDIEEGKAPSIDNISEWCGTADMIRCDSTTTKFINPALMFEGEPDENGNREFSTIYKGMINFLKAELKKSQEDGSNDVAVIHSLKKRLNCLESNMVEYLIGGVTVTDRDSLRDLVEDAVLNCRSAQKYGVGYGANFEGLWAYCTEKVDIDDSLISDMYDIIGEAYMDMAISLYSTCMTRDEACRTMRKSLDIGSPYNMRTKHYDGLVLTSLNSDPVILDTIARIITIMFTANQALLVSPLNNKYIEKDDIDEGDVIKNLNVK